MGFEVSKTQLALSASYLRMEMQLPATAAALCLLACIMLCTVMAMDADPLKPHASNKVYLLCASLVT